MAKNKLQNTCTALRCQLRVVLLLSTHLTGLLHADFLAKNMSERKVACSDCPWSIVRPSIVGVHLHMLTYRHVNVLLKC